MLNKKIIKNGLGFLTFSLMLSTSITTNLSAANVKLESNHDYLVTETRPNNIVLADLKTNKVINECKTDESFSPGGVILSPDYKIAYVLGGYGEEIGGYEIETCKKVFHASLTQGNVRAKSLSGIAVNEDGKQVYAIYNRTEIGNDSYTVLDPYFSVYNVADGIDAKAVKSFAIPRHMTMISTAKDGTVYGTGTHLYEINPKTGDVKIAKTMGDWNKKGWSNPDPTATYMIGQLQGEFTTGYTATKEDPSNPDGVLYWGMTTVDLNTKKIDQIEFAVYETSMFTIIKNPKDQNILYGVLNDLTKFDLKEQKALKRVTTDHSYYIVVPSADGQKLYLGGCLNDIAVYDANTLEKQANIQLSGDMGSVGLQVFHTK